jgi:hypothetical protein
MTAPIESPTPVLDALEKHAGGPLDELWAGGISRFLTDASRVPIVSLPENVHPFGNFFDEGYPARGTQISDEEMWIESRTPLLGGNERDGLGFDRGILTGALVERIESNSREDTDPWPFDLLSMRFAVLVGAASAICAGRVIVSPYVYNDPPEEYAIGKVDRYDFADSERSRFGIKPAATATDVELLRMHGCALDLEGRYLRGIPAGSVKIKHDRISRYAAAPEEGLEGLRAGLMAAHAEAWLPADTHELDPAFVNTLENLMCSVVIRGPLIALRLLAALGRKKPSAFNTSPLPAPYDRGRRAIAMSLPGSPQSSSDRS